MKNGEGVRCGYIPSCPLTSLTLIILNVNHAASGFCFPIRISNFQFTISTFPFLTSYGFLDFLRFDDPLLHSIHFLPSHIPLIHFVPNKSIQYNAHNFLLNFNKLNEISSESLLCGITHTSSQPVDKTTGRMIYGRRRREGRHGNAVGIKPKRHFGFKRNDCGAYAVEHDGRSGARGHIQGMGFAWEVNPHDLLYVFRRRLGRSGENGVHGCWIIQSANLSEASGKGLVAHDGGVVFKKIRGLPFEKTLDASPTSSPACFPIANGAVVHVAFKVLKHAAETKSCFR